MLGTVLSLIHTNSFNLAEVGIIIPILQVGNQSAETFGCLPKVVLLIRERAALKLSLAIQALNHSMLPPTFFLDGLSFTPIF